MIIDAFTYYNETDVLRIRLEELDEYVDYFVVVEADQTFTGLPKPFYFDDLDWVSKWSHKIVRHKVSFPKRDMTPWEREYYQRNAIREAVAFAPGYAVICISDADEIINMRMVELDNYYDGEYPIRISNRQFFWNLNWQVPQHCNQGARPVAVLNEELQSSYYPQDLRAEKLPWRGGVGGFTRITGGWHFSFLGDAERARLKIESFAHQEMNTEEFKSAKHIERCATYGIDPFDRFPLRYTSIDHLYPIWVQKNQDKLQHLIIPPP